MKNGLKRTMVFAFVLLVVFSLFMTSCKKKEAEEKKATFTVGMATDVGGLGDKSFNDGAYQGILAAQKKLGVIPVVVESKQQTDYVPNLSGLAEDGADLVFAVGFLMADAILEAAKNNPGTNGMNSSRRSEKCVTGLRSFRVQKAAYRTRCHCIYVRFARYR